MAIYCPSCGRSLPNDARVCAYCGKSIPSHGVMTAPEPEQRKDRTVLIIVAVILILFIIPVIISAAVYIYVSGIMPEPHTHKMPLICFEKDENENTLTVAPVSSMSSETSWSDISIVGEGTPPTNGYITAGDVITNCYGEIEIVYTPTNTVIASFTFSD